MPEIKNWKKNLIALGISQFIYRIGSRSLIPFIPLFIRDIGNTTTEQTVLWSGWILAAPFIVSFFTTPFWGSYGDRHGRKLIVLLSLLGFSVSLVAMSLVNSLLFLFVASSIQEIFGGAYPAAISITAANTPKEESTKALSYIQFANSLGNILGPFIGGILADAFGSRLTLLIIGFIVIASLPIVGLFVKEEHFDKVNRESKLLKNLNTFLKSRMLMYCGIALLVYTLAVTMMRPGFTLFVAAKFQRTDYSASTAGFLLSLFGAAGSLSVLLLPWFIKFISHIRLLIVVFIFSSIGFILIPLQSNIFLFTVFLTLVGFGLGIFLPVIYSLMNFETKEINKAGIMSIGSNFQMVGNLVGPLLAGIIVSNCGLHSTYLLSAIVFILSACALIYHKRLLVY